MFYVHTVLCFGWCVAPEICRSRRDTVAQYFRSKDIPIPTWLKDFWRLILRTTHDLGLIDQQNAARKGTVLVLTVFYRCGYFMAFSNCSLKPRNDLTGSNRQTKYIFQSTSGKMYEYVRNGTTGQLVRAPHVRPVATFKRSGGPNLTSIVLSNRRVVRGEDSVERCTVVRGVPTRSDHHRGHRRLVLNMGRAA